MKRFTAALAACVLLLAGCGGSNAPTTHRTSAGAVVYVPAPPSRRALTIPERCPSGKSFMGCSVGGSPRAVQSIPAGTRAISLAPGQKFPDVSSYQGCSINWPAIPVPGAIVKAWEYSQDPCLAHNATSLIASKKAWTMYDFVRYCTASSFIALYNHYRPPLPPVLDEEVSNAANCTGPLAAQIHAESYNHVWPVEYTSPGTEQAGASADDLVLWVASFGASHAPCLWRCPAAWQYASPPTST